MTSNTSFVSVIIPTCNRAMLLLQCVASILAGTYAHYEILIIDQDAKQTLKERLMQDFPDESRVVYLFLDKGGASRARNYGVQRARGHIVAFIDDDAVADPLWLSAIVELFETVQPQPALMAGRIDPIWNDRRPDWYPVEREYLLGLYNIGNDIRVMPEHDLPIGANMAGLRDIVIKLGGFDENLGPNYFRKQPMLTGEETLLAQRVKKDGHSIYYHPQARVSHHISKRKLKRVYFLRRHFWEGVTVIKEMHLLGELSSGKQKHFRYHTREIALSLHAAARPPATHASKESRAAARMLALSRTAFSAGVIYGLMTLDRV